MKGHEPLAQKAFYEIMHGHWARQPGWRARMETECMTVTKLTYSQESVEDAQNKCLWKGYVVACCILRGTFLTWKGSWWKICESVPNHPIMSMSFQKTVNMRTHLINKGTTQGGTHDYAVTQFSSNGSGNESLPLVSDGLLFVDYFYLIIVAANLLYCWL